MNEIRGVNDKKEDDHVAALEEQVMMFKAEANQEVMTNLQKFPQPNAQPVLDLHMRRRNVKARKLGDTLVKKLVISKALKHVITERRARLKPRLLLLNVSIQMTRWTPICLLVV